ncbi:DUF2207 domain-containing protein [Naumannella halotolerans]|uniref:Putative membrane protein n=1 Tax=Naumannella halotolerans TaxID=993414 RepID=A0A4R7JB03_9ACTN|nr:DUF2207 domain-containing protein [Naumannella halotolerans]TDT33763.1 putative membrane protein [Naumannella halotolerans]
MTQADGATTRRSDLPGRIRRGAMRAAALTGATALATVGLLPGLAHAESGDVITSFDIDYVVNADGTVEVTETIDYSFAGSDRHGIYRELAIREEDPDNPGMDMVYEIDDLSVQSPTGASPRYTETEDESGRNRTMTLQIGSSSQTVDSSETYVISYDVKGALRAQDGFDEFYWDATGFDWDAPIENVEISVEVPDGVQDSSCFQGAVGSTETCTTSVDDEGVATYSASDLATGEGVSIGAAITKGAVTNVGPILVEDGSKMSSEDRRDLTIGGIVFGAIGLGSPLVGWLWYRRNGRDDRYAGIPPGTVPTDPANAKIVKHDKTVQIPVAFAPPKIPVGEAGYVIDGKITGEETAAVLVDLAVKGAVKIHGERADDYEVELLDPGRAANPEDTVFLNALFPGPQRPGQRVAIGGRSSLERPADQLRQVIEDQVHAHGWFKVRPRAGRAGKWTGSIGMIFVLGWIVINIGWLLLLPMLLLAGPIITWLVVRAKMKSGTRTAEGRAITDQVEGFRTYLATAEANQLKFEEGQDIFSRYLPWAIVFNLADRWEKVCEQAMQAGYIPQTDYYWYAGGPGFQFFNAYAFASMVNTSAAPPPPPPSSGGGGGFSGSGFGSGGSSFGGGGFSGGGGGGGGGGSW